MKAKKIREGIGADAIQALFLGLLLGALAPAASAQVLTHRYSFNDAPGTFEVRDAVGTAHGTLFGTGDHEGNGSLVLEGVDGYVDLPPGLISGYTSMTVEAWASFGANSSWVRLFDFGDTDAITGNGAYGMEFCPHSGSGEVVFEVFDANPGYDHAVGISFGPALDNQGKVHLAVVYDPEAPWTAVYVNGFLAASSSSIDIPFSSFNNTHSYLGRSGYLSDPYLNATLDEFRVYSGALSPLQVAMSAAAGPSSIVAEPGALTGIHLTVPAPVYAGQTLVQAVVTGNYENVKGVNLAFGATLESGDTNIVAIGSNLRFNAKAAGSTTLVAAFGGFSVTQAVDVLEVPATLTHRYNFDEPAQSTAFSDSVGTAHGSVIGTANLDGTGRLVLPGGEAGANHAELPAHLIDGYDAVTFEFWVAFGQNPAWGRLIDFGDSNPDTSLGRFCIDFTPHSGNTPAGVNFEVSDADPGFDHTQTVAVGPVLDERGMMHLVLTYNPLAQSMSVHTNGVLMGRNTGVTIPMSAIVNAHSWLGRSSYLGDPCGVAEIDEFRIYEGALSEFRIALNAASGSGTYVAEPGTLHTLHLGVSSSAVVGQTLTASVTGDYSNVQGLNLAFANPVLQSGNSEVIQVGENLTFTAAGPGSATLTATYGGLSATATVTVTDLPAPMAHRYSFNEPAGSPTFADAVGTATGTVIGSASLDGAGRLVLPGGSAGESYAELPPHLIDGYDALTFEFWVEFGNSPTWGRLVDFGDTEEGGTSGQNFIDFTPHSGFDPNGANLEVNGPTGTETLNVPPILDGQNLHLVLVYNPGGQYLAIYTNAVLMGINRNVTVPISAINNAHSWLGASSYIADPCGVATIDEFRIYNGALSAYRVKNSFAAGPNSLPAPALSLAHSGASITLSWPEEASDCTLQTTARLGAGSAWAAPAGNPAPVISNGRCQVTLPVGAEAAFYRLVRQP